MVIQFIVQFNFYLHYTKGRIAFCVLVVKRISQIPPKNQLQVRFLSGTPFTHLFFEIGMFF